VNWLDDASWEVLADVIQRVNEMRVYIVLTSRFATIREERPARLPTPLTYRRLLPLTEDALVSLVRGAADEHGVSVPEDVERWIIRGCEGNPLMFRALLEHWAHRERRWAPPLAECAYRSTHRPVTCTRSTSTQRDQSTRCVCFP